MDLTRGPANTTITQIGPNEDAYDLSRRARPVQVVRTTSSDVDEVQIIKTVAPLATQLVVVHSGL